ncbi:uncharacterized protein LOC143353010 [Halictus rubicundus]|uniref:uncharacterized protein LOC143353010 n=1 Tax=Halictus rubicundus TaxID=77578 RepID=UPI004036F24E
MGSSHIRQIQFLILSTLISAALCYTSHGSIASESVLKSFPDDGGGTPALKFVYTIEDPETKIPCTLANMSISVVVDYATKQKAVVSNEVKIPSNAVVKGACGSMVSEMSLIWETQEHDKFQQNVVKFLLFNDRTNFSVFSIDVDLFLDSANFPDAADERRTTRSNIDLGLFDAPVEDGLHKCPQDRRIKVDNDTALIVSDVSFIAFNTKKDYGQRKETICEDATNTKVFPIHYKDTRYGVGFLARMSFVLEIPYLTINDTTAKHTVQLPTPNTIFVYVSKSDTDDTLSGHLSMYFMSPDVLSFYDIRIYFNQYTDGVAYISGVNLDISIPKKDLPDAKHGVDKIVRKQFVLFPAPSDSGIFSCSRGITLNMEDIRLQMTDVLLVMFEETGDFSSKQVIDCNTQPRLTAKDFNYVVREKHGDVPCILANMSISIRIPYNSIGIVGTVYTNITVPTNATAHGVCGPSLSKMELTWPAKGNQLNSVAFYLSGDSDFSMFHLETKIYADNTSFPNNFDWDLDRWYLHQSNVSLGMFVGPKNNGWYNCPERQEIISAGWSRIIISNVSLIAFNDQEDLITKNAYACPGDEDENGNTVHPHPSEAAFKYVMREKGESIACILANMTISVKVTYKTKSRSNRETTFLVPKDGVNVTGHCDCRNPEMTLSWLPEGVVSDPEHPDKTRNSIKLTFGGDTLSYHVNMITVGFYLDEKKFPDASESRYEITERKLDLFSSYMRSIYKCDLETVVELRNVQLTFNDIALTAFNKYRNVTNLTVDKCIVPAGVSIHIIVASIGGGLVIGCVIAIIIRACVRYYKKHQRL